MHRFTGTLSSSVEARFSLDDSPHWIRVPLSAKGSTKESVLNELMNQFREMVIGRAKDEYFSVTFSNGHSLPLDFIAGYIPEKYPASHGIVVLGEIVLAVPKGQLDLGYLGIYQVTDEPTVCDSDKFKDRPMFQAPLTLPKGVLRSRLYPWSKPKRFWKPVTKIQVIGRKGEHRRIETY